MGGVRRGTHKASATPTPQPNSGGPSGKRQRLQQQSSASSNPVAAVAAATAAAASLLPSRPQPPKPQGEVAELLEELGSLAHDLCEPGDYWVHCEWDLEGLRSDVILQRRAVFEGLTPFEAFGNSVASKRRAEAALIRAEEEEAATAAAEAAEAAALVEASAAQHYGYIPIEGFGELQGDDSALGEFDEGVDIYGDPALAAQATEGEIRWAEDDFDLDMGLDFVDAASNAFQGVLGIDTVGFTEACPDIAMDSVSFGDGIGGDGLEGLDLLGFGDYAGAEDFAMSPLLGGEGFAQSPLLSEYSSFPFSTVEGCGMLGSTDLDGYVSEDFGFEDFGEIYSFGGAASPEASPLADVGGDDEELDLLLADVAREDALVGCGVDGALQGDRCLEEICSSVPPFLVAMDSFDEFLKLGQLTRQPSTFSEAVLGNATADGSLWTATLMGSTAKARGATPKAIGSRPKATPSVSASTMPPPPPPVAKAAAADANATTGEVPQAKPAEESKPAPARKPPPWTEAESEAWAKACRFKPGDTPTFTVAMAKVGLGDGGMPRWCQWLGHRLRKAASHGWTGHARAESVDLSSNKLGEQGVAAFCRFLEMYRVRCAVVKLNDNAIDDKAMKELARYFSSFSQAPILELHLTHNKISVRGVLWFLACLAMHPGYPIHDRARMAFLPLWLRLEHNAMTSREAAVLLNAALSPLHIVACGGEDPEHCSTARCRMMRAKGALKHNCVAHLSNFTLQTGPRQQFPTLAAPELHASPLFECRQAVVPWSEVAQLIPSSLAQEMQRMEPQVLFEDIDMLILLKPAGWICTAAGADMSCANLEVQQRLDAVRELQARTAPAPLPQYLALRFGLSSPLCRDVSCLCGLVFRLDLDTSGPVLVAKTKAGFEAAKSQMKARDLVKDYVCLVHGSTKVKPSGDVREAIDDSTYEAKSVVRVGPNGKDAITVYETIGEYADDNQETYSLIHLRLITGRPHQARIHMAHLGHPIVCDTRYIIDAKKKARDKAWCPRLFLHMVRLGFCTTSNMPICAWSPLTMAPELLRALSSLRPLLGGATSVGLAASTASLGSPPPASP